MSSSLLAQATQLQTAKRGVPTVHTGGSTCQILAEPAPTETTTPRGILVTDIWWKCHSFEHQYI